MRLNLRRFRQSLSRDVSVPVTQQAPPVPALFPTAINIIHVADWSADIRASPDASPCYVESIDFKKAIRPNHHVDVVQQDAQEKVELISGRLDSQATKSRQFRIKPFAKAQH